MIPYAKHHLEAEDMMEVLRVLQGPTITQGTMIEWFEDEFKKATGSRYAIALSSGTASLHASLVGAEIEAGDEVIVPSMTFVATANVVKYMNAIPVFADIDEKTLLIDTDDVVRKITPKTRAIIAVDFAGQPCDYERLREICAMHNLVLIADACHSLGATYKDKKVGSLADFNCFSLHASKLITSGEGGVITTNSKKANDKITAFRNHGRVNGDMTFLGCNYRMSHLQAAVCIHQIKRIPSLITARQRLAGIYDTAMEKMGIQGLAQEADRTNARHIYVIVSNNRDSFRLKLDTYGIGTQIHYKPVTLQSFYNCPGATPRAEGIWEKLFTIPLFPQLADGQQEMIIRGLENAILKIRKTEAI